MKHLYCNAWTKTFFFLFGLTLSLPLSAQEAADSAATDSLTKELQEVTVQADVVTQRGNQTTYIVTKEMRRGAYDAGDLLANLPDIQYNRITKEVKFAGRNNIKILVDSMEKNASYIKELTHIRFDKIDVIRFPTGKYADYDMVINFHTKENYEGYDINVSTRITIKTRYTSGKILSNNNDDGSFTYTRNKWNFMVKTYYLFNRGQSFRDYETSYKVNNLHEKSIANPGGKPNSENYTRRWNLEMSMDYQFNKNHSLSLSYFYVSESHDNYSLSRMLSGPLDQPIETLDTITRQGVARDNGSRLTLGLFYRGKIHGWDIWTGANYSHNPWKTRNETERSSGFMIEDNQRQRINNTWANVDINKSFFDNKLGLNIGYEHMWRKYTGRMLETGVELSSSISRRNRVYSTLSYFFPSGLSLSINGGVTSNNNNTDSYKEKQTMANYGASLNKRFNRLYCSLSYSARTSNPSVYLMKGYGQFTDSLMWSGGNPSLKSGTTHLLSTYISHSCGLSLMANASFSPSNVTSITEERTGMRPDGTVGPYIASQPQNTYSKSLNLSVGYNGRIKDLFYSISGGWSESYASYGEMHNRIGRPECAVHFNYSYIPKSFSISMTYLMNASPLAFPQGYSKSHTDQFDLSVMKTWLNGALSLTVEYIPPLHFTSGKSISWTETPVYTNYSLSNPQHYDSNRFWIRVSYRISGGKSVRQYKRTIFDTEK